MKATVDCQCNRVVQLGTKNLVLQLQSGKTGMESLILRHRSFHSKAVGSDKIEPPGLFSELFSLIFHMKLVNKFLKPLGMYSADLQSARTCFS